VFNSARIYDWPQNISPLVPQWSLGRPIETVAGEELLLYWRPCRPMAS